MGIWSDYATKTPPADADDIMIYDAAGKANRRVVLTGLWDWIIVKLTNAVIGKLETDNKTIVGAINGLNAARYPFLSKGTVVTSENLNTATASGLQDKIYGKACTNSPGFGCFILNVKESSTNAIFQIALGYQNSNIAVRTGNNAGTWTTWVIIHKDE
ncbi:pyocin knob domain-containing protein [Blautia sp. MSJ-19]|uniref:pyocin knob domain-containing protein n=1 Tax=Blautia sp. MSJ-19 TaxID=2841517 RepID=UPI001C0ED832|nr:pyocin knob domain-containing protein [Blautia sp. MSJ-19]MBU5481743.1 pyocin knob domain-containing protein [Blautia sp. MSJ-19]